LFDKTLLLLILLIASGCFSGNSDQDGCKAELHNSFLNIKLGDAIVEVEKAYPLIYKNQISPLGDFLYETCNQKKLEVVSFEENNHFKNKIVSVVTRVTKEAICRDANGALPDFGVDIVTHEGIRLGMARADIENTYGRPCVVRSMKDGSTGLIYRSKETVKEINSSTPYYFFHLRDGKISGITFALDWQNTLSKKK
jgi:hypothetical protein